MSIHYELVWNNIPDVENYRISNTSLIKNVKIGKMKKLIENPNKNPLKTD
jgi:hypothetical protein